MEGEGEGWCGVCMEGRRKKKPGQTDVQRQKERDRDEERQLERG